MNFQGPEFATSLVSQFQKENGHPNKIGRSYPHLTDLSASHAKTPAQQSNPLTGSSSARRWTPGTDVTPKCWPAAYPFSMSAKTPSRGVRCDRSLPAARAKIVPRCSRFLNGDKFIITQREGSGGSAAGDCRSGGTRPQNILLTSHSSRGLGPTSRFPMTRASSALTSS